MSNFSNATLDWDKDNTPRSTQYGDIYFSDADAIGESDYVFLEKNNLKQRWQNFSDDTFIIAECGFGSGLNFLNSCKLWCENSTSNAQLHYIACENHPLLKKDILRLHAKWPQLTHYSQKLLQLYPDHSAGIHRLHLTIKSKKITLDLLYGDACTSLNSVYQSEGFRVNAWYLDGFSPRLNPEMWSPQLFRIIALLSKNKTSLSTYSVAGYIRRGLAEVGFEVYKEPGYAQKRHMLCAHFVESETPETIQNSATPWFTLPAQKPRQNKNVCIIGAGLAGCSSAYALAQKGWKVTLIEREFTIANMASGNPKGILHCKISKEENAYSNFMLQSYLYASRHYQTLEQENTIHWQQCGSLQLAYNEPEQQKQKLILQQLRYSDKLFLATDAAKNSLIAGVSIAMDGLFFPESACLNPHALCKVYCSHPAVNVVLCTETIELEKIDRKWQVKSLDKDNRNTLICSDVVIIANSVDANNFAASENYPLTQNRGQVDFYKESALSKNLKTSLCTNAYITPASEGTHSIGGSYTPDCNNNIVSSEDTRENLNLLEAALPDVAIDFRKQTNTGARAAIRCSTPDYIPVIGPVESFQINKEKYSELSLNAKKKITTLAEYETDLFINVAHGSHGITTTPLAAEYLASLIDNKPLPLPDEQVNCMHPIRFLIRDLKKQKI